MTECKLCQQGAPAIIVRCFDCMNTFHIHKSQLDMAPEDSIVIGNCPTCKIINCWHKRNSQLAYRGRTLLDPGQPILDLRFKDGTSL
ncbi:hypothetical protein ES705_27317 [subsurface metagenome]